MTRGVWGEREERWLRERYAYEHAPQLVAEFEREFGKKVSKGALYTRAKQRVCSYFGIDPENASCEDCPYGSSQTGRLCWRNASLDMIARAKKLAGIEGEAQR